MRILRHPGRIDVARGPRVITLGNFDGVHLGHQEILRRAVDRAARANGIPIAVSFYPHPAVVLAPARAPLLLTTLRQRVERLAAQEITLLVLYHFTRRFAAVEAERFVLDYLVGALGVSQLVVGHDVGFGNRRGGNADLLEDMGRRIGFEVEVVSPVEAEGLVVSSSAIRAAIHSGDLANAARMLGRPYSVGGRVVHGHHRGAQIGFPTANLRLHGIQLPPDGVYAVRARIGGELVPGVANVGMKPTFGDRERTVETHLFEFGADLYGRRIEVEFAARLREERKFPSVDALVRQIRDDANAARRLLGVR